MLRRNSRRRPLSTIPHFFWLQQIITQDISWGPYSLGAIPPFTTPFTTVPISVQNGRTDQGLITRQQLIKLQRRIGFSPSLLQYLGTFSREINRPAPSWPQLTSSSADARWD